MIRSGPNWKNRQGSKKTRAKLRIQYSNDLRKIFKFPLTVKSVDKENGNFAEKCPKIDEGTKNGEIEQNI